MTLSTATTTTEQARRERSAMRAVLLMLVSTALTDSYAWVLATQMGAWQMQVVAGLLAVYALSLLFAVRMVRQGRPERALYFMTGGLLFTGLVVSTYISGLGTASLFVLPLLAAVMLARLVSTPAVAIAVSVAFAVGLVNLVGDRSVSASFRLAVPAAALALNAGAVGLAAAYLLLVHRLLANLGLRAKLILAFVVVALVPLATLAYLNDSSARQVLTEAANKTLLGVAAQTAESLDTFVSTTSNVLLNESQNSDLRAYLALPLEVREGSEAERRVTAIMSDWALRDARAQVYMVLNNDGVVVRSTDPAEIGQNHAQSDFFLGAVETRQVYITDVQFFPGNVDGHFYFSILIKDQNLRSLGVLAARFTATAIQDIIVRTTGLAGADSFGAVFDRDLIHLAHGTAPETLYKLVGPATPEKIAELEAQDRLPTLPGFEYSTNLPDLEARLANADEEPFFSATDVATGDRVLQVAVKRMSTLPWLVAFFQPQDVFLAPVQQQTRDTIVLAGIITVIVTGLALLIAQLLAGPIARLTQVAEQVTSGQLTVQAEVDSRDEIGVLASTFNAMTTRLRELIGTLEQRVAERTDQLQAAADISRATASVRDLNELLRLALDLIRERFGFYHASIFLIDTTGQYALLRESTGTIGAQLKARGHKLSVGSRSLIGWVTQNRQARVALDVGDDPFHFKNPLLPDTRSELAIPLIVGSRLLGVLDVQSIKSNAFGPTEVQVLQTVSDQLSIAIENAELFERTQASLNELRTLYQRIAGASWRGMLRDQSTERVYTTAPDESAAVAEAAPLAVPLVLRDQQVGLIEIHGRPLEQWSAEEQAALGTLAAQVATALESAALLQETQRRRLQEQLINDITQQMRATLNPAAVAQSGIRELGRALGATEVVVRLTSGSTAATRAGNGNHEPERPEDGR